VCVLPHNSHDFINSVLLFWVLHSQVLISKRTYSVQTAINLKVKIF
jgi:hypothetical protein